jgi:hypothetical protein
MPNQLQEFDFTLAARSASHKWDKWLDGTIWQFKKDVDFAIGTKRFARNARVAASHRKMKIRLVIDAEIVTLQAYTPEESK